MKETEKKYAGVIIDISTETLDRPFEYRIPEALRGVLEEGMEFRMKMSTSGLNATMLFYRESKRYVIEAGSTINRATYNSCSKGIAAFRKEVIENKKLCQAGDLLCTLLQDIEIPETSCSPSGAASFCAGTSFQGTVAWEDKDGKRYPSNWWKE